MAKKWMKNWISKLCSQTIYLYSINKRPFQINAPTQINAQSKFLF